MTRRYFNWRLAIVLLMGAMVLAATAFGLRRWQRNTRADQALPLGQAAYADQRWDEAASQLGRYLAVYYQDVPILLKYADAQLNMRPLTSSNIEQAVTAYRSVLRLDKGNAEAANRLVELYLGTSSPGEAELIARRYLEDGNEDLGLRRMLAEALERQRKFGEARMELANIIKAHPDDIFAYQKVGQLAEQRRGEVNEPPAFWYNEAVSKNPDSALAYAVRAAFHLRNANRSQALADLERAQECDLSDTEVRLSVARALIHADQLDKAREHLEVLKAQASADERVWQGWAELALKSGSSDEMHQVAEAALEALASQPWDFMPTVIELFIRSDHIDKAEEHLSRMRQKNMLPAVVSFLEGLLAEKQGRFRDAIVAWQQAIGRGYKPPQSRMLLASAFSRIGDSQSAIAQLRIVVSENPGYREGHLALARLLAQQRNWPEVLEEARRVQQISPGHGEAALMEVQARIHILARDRGPAQGQEKAWQEINARLLQLDKATNSAPQVMLLRAQAALAQGKHAEAAEVLDEIQRADPSQSSAALLRAELCIAQGSEQDAVNLLRATVEEHPQDFDAVRSLILLLNHQARQGECESVAEEAFARMEEPQVRRNVGLLLATLYRQWKQEDKRYQWLADLAQEFPNDIQIKRRLLTCGRVTQDTEGQAQRIIDEIKLLEGDEGWQWRYEQARCWIGSDSFEDSYGQVVALLQENLLMNPQDQASRLLLGAAHEKAGELRLAIATYREALSRSPENVQVIVRAAAALFKAEEDDEAKELLNQAAELELDDPDLQKLRLYDHLRDEAWASASDILRELVREDPNDLSGRLSLSLLLMRQNKFDEAQAILDDLKAKGPPSISVTATQVQLHIQQGHAEEAIRLCDEVVDNLANAFAYLLRAQTYVALKQNEKALADFGRAIEMAPDKADVWTARGDFYQLLGQPRDAIEDITKALELASDSLPIQKRAISLFLASGDASLIRRAGELLDRARVASPEDTQLKLYEARLLLLEGTTRSAEQARRLLREITDERPKLAEGWQLLGRLALHEGQPGRAVDLALRGMVHCAEDSAGYRGLLLLKAEAEARRSPALAVPTLKAWVEDHPDDTDVIVQLADIYTRAGQPQQAIELLRQHLKDLSDPRARRRSEAALAIALYRNGEKESATLLVDALLQAAPDDVGTPVAVAGALAVGGDQEALPAAEDILRTVLERHPKSLPALSLLAMVVQSAGRGDESAALNRRILELDPNNPVAINNLAWLLCEEQGEYQDALDLAERGMKIAPEYADLLDTRGVAYYRLGHFDKAADDFTKCLQLFPPGSPASTVSRFHLARAYAEMGHKTQAVEQLKRTLDLHDQIGGLSSENLSDAKLLLEQLQKGS